MDFNEIRSRGDLLFESIRGSHLFGLNTEKPDVDTFGVFCGPEDWFLGNGKDRQDMVKSEKSDDYWDELGKYFFELGKSNPEALVSLFTPEKFILHFDPVLQPLWDIREQLLTKECFKSFSGYAYSQIKKAKGLKKAINTDPEEVKERKNPLHFCQVPVGIGIHTLIKWLDDNGLKQEYCGISRLPNTNESYSLFYDWGKARESGETVPEQYIDKDPIGYRGILAPDDPLTSQLRLSSIPKGENPLCWFQFNSNSYTSHCTDYKRYWDWVKNRNPERFKLNTGHNYDCYRENTTQFLTQNEWKWFHEIDDTDLVGCFDNSGHLRFSKILSKTKHVGDRQNPVLVYNYEDHKNRISFSVTLNHRLFLRREDEDEYKLITVKDWLEQSKQYKFYQLGSLVNDRQDNPDYSDDLLKLFGYSAVYGSYTRLNDNCDSTLTLHLLDEIIPTVRKVFEGIDWSYKDSSSSYYDKITEIVINKALESTNVGKIYKFIFTLEGSTGCTTICNNLSTRQINLILSSYTKYSNLYDRNIITEKTKALYKIRKDNIGFLYRDLMCLSDDGLFKDDDNELILLKALGFKCSESTIPGTNLLQYRKNKRPEEVFIDPEKGKVKSLGIDLFENTSVVCLETEYGTLITRNFQATDNIPRISVGIAFHGNSKNMSHCVRIFTMAKEIAEGKGMLLDRTDIDKEFLMSVKNHELSYEEIIKHVEDLKEEMEESFLKSNLPDSPDLDLLNKIMIDIRKSHYGKGR